MKTPADIAYNERNRLVALLAKLYPSSLEIDDCEEPEWQWVVFINLPTGQASWHIHESELYLFSHVQRLNGTTWDGHSNQEKYRRIEQLCERHDNVTQFFQEWNNTGDKMCIDCCGSGKKLYPNTATWRSKPGHEYIETEIEIKLHPGDKIELDQ